MREIVQTLEYKHPSPPNLKIATYINTNLFHKLKTCFAANTCCCMMSPETQKEKKYYYGS